MKMLLHEAHWPHFSFWGFAVSVGIPALWKWPNRPQFTCPRCCTSILNQTNQDRIPSWYISSHWLSRLQARYQCDITADCWTWPQGLVSHTEEQNTVEWLWESIHPFSKLLIPMTVRTQEKNRMRFTNNISPLLCFLLQNVYCLLNHCYCHSKGSYLEEIKDEWMEGGWRR